LAAAEGDETEKTSKDEEELRNPKHVNEVSEVFQSGQAPSVDFQGSVGLSRRLRK
jgi:hypothetical protein